MSEQRTHDLIHDLVEGLVPVERAPRLATGIGLVVLAWSAVLASMLVFKSPPAELVARLASAGWQSSGVVLGLSISAAGGALAGLAASAPGRALLERRARRVALAGLVLALLCAGAAWLTQASRGALAAPLAADLACFSKAIALALLPGVVLLTLLRCGYVLNPRRAAVLALLGAFGLGALTIQLVCPIEGARHMLFGHTGVALVMTPALLLPLAGWLRHGRDARGR